MSTATSAQPHVGSQGATKVAALCSVLFGLSMFVLVGSVNVPREAGDEELTTFWEGGENLTGASISAYAALLAALCLVVIVNHVRLLVPEHATASEQEHLAGFAHGLATMCAATLVVVGAMRGAIAHLVRSEDLPLPGPDVLRYATSLGYSLLDVGTMGLLGLTMVATSVMILRGKVLGRWVGLLGSACGGVTLIAVVLGFGAFSTPMAILWGLGLAAAVLRPGAAA